VKQAFAELYHADRSAQILNESRELLTSFLHSARARYESGEGLLQNVLKAQTEITKLDAEMEKLVEERRAASALLNTLAGRPADTLLGPALSLPEASAPPDPAAIEARAIERAPEILEQQATILREQARLELARLMMKPDFIWGAGYGYRGGLDPEVNGSLGLRLPLFRQRKQAQAIAQTSQEVETARRELESRKLKVAAEVRRWLAQVTRAGNLERLYQEGVIPQARLALESSAAAFGVGRVDFLTLLSDFGTVLAYELDYVTQHHERVLALAALERLADEELVPAANPRERDEP
jgi:outer membrane protein, heavy metal efflux system